jgi:FdhD protein
LECRPRRACGGLDGEPITVTMRTPGSDVELAQGFLLTEGVIGHRDDVLTVRYCKGAGPDNMNTYTVLDVTLAPDVAMPQVDITRNFYTTSSCWVYARTSAGTTPSTRSSAGPSNRTRSRPDRIKR